MPIYPAPLNLIPPKDTDVPFDKTLATAGAKMDLVAVPDGKVGRSFSIRNEGPGDAFVKCDGDATTASSRIRMGETYAEDDLSITNKITFIGESNKKPRVSGVLWCGN